MPPFLKVLLKARQSSEVVLAVAMAAVLGALIIPLPAWLLDMGLAVNLAAAVALLVAALNAKDALRVTSFPTLLLFTTLFRLSLNVSSTRLALSEGHAGEVIQAFGEFVVRGDYVVGAVVFAILTLVQLLVVTKGAERVAEVSARFTLDAMPGKQMSIDADLRAGAIDQTQARRRRRDLERESQMFGAMDGAMKFVKGDVIAGLVIVAVNLLGGTLIGVLQNGQSFSEAAATFALIAIGDGLVSQVPSLCIAVAAGLVVTRVASEKEEDSLGAEIGSQFFGDFRTLLTVAGLCVALALMPGMPHLTFLSLAAGLGGLGYALRRKGQAPEKSPSKDGASSEAAVPAGAAGKPPESAKAPVGVTPLTLDLSAQLTPLAEADGGAFVHSVLNAVRDELFFELGVRIPGIRVRTHAAYLGPGEYRILLDEVPAGGGVVQPGALYALVPPGELAFLEVQAEAAVEPSSGRPISRVGEGARSRLELAQVPVRKPSELIADHLRAVLRLRAAALLGLQEVQGLLEGLEAQSPVLVKEALQKVPLPLLVDVLRRLVQEQVSIRDLRAILEALVAPTTEGDATALAERCRQALHRYLSHQFAPTGPLYAYLVDPDVEEVLRASGPRGHAPEPERIMEILEGVRVIANGGRAVLLTAPDIRRPLRKLCEGPFPDVAVLTYGELDGDLQIRPIGRLSPVAVGR
ncbi:FHIPEP family type III secretion protein [Corallococcus exiguus]|uniref:flagellar biosynthesis protein FlhA n=1 Tax=Corallococcus TaxID=83461 RepID=UPI000ECAD009|nr:MULTISPECIES: flagellar biosynthesis protein FlhA [Corallococcus]NNC19305.1 FHIPEP family type III secretion protein [Corallococcus exiguus]NRD66430.1 FHIPEP family type III secretion protein [Corallococcus exiguus]RKI02508.1 flagellar type III secretion system protein FlhA [Corallococcus sp. AB030]RUO94197.1 flagellar type III secretion system protein FlhA [Corallococcus sp. AB018]